MNNIVTIIPSELILDICVSFLDYKSLARFSATCSFYRKLLSVQLWGSLKFEDGKTAHSYLTTVSEQNAQYTHTLILLPATELRDEDLFTYRISGVMVRPDTIEEANANTRRNMNKAVEREVLKRCLKYVESVTVFDTNFLDLFGILKDYSSCEAGGESVVETIAIGDAGKDLESNDVKQEEVKEMNVDVNVGNLRLREITIDTSKMQNEPLYENVALFFPDYEHWRFPSVTHIHMTGVRGKCGAAHDLDKIGVWFPNLVQVTVALCQEGTFESTYLMLEGLVLESTSVKCVVFQGVQMSLLDTRGFWVLMKRVQNLGVKVLIDPTGLEQCWTPDPRILEPSPNKLMFLPFNTLLSAAPEYAPHEAIEFLLSALPPTVEFIFLIWTFNQSLSLLSPQARESLVTGLVLLSPRIVGFEFYAPFAEFSQLHYDFYQELFSVFTETVKTRKMQAKRLSEKNKNREEEGKMMWMFESLNEQQIAFFSRFMLETPGPRQLSVSFGGEVEDLNFGKKVLEECGRLQAIKISEAEDPNSVEPMFDTLIFELVNGYHEEMQHTFKLIPDDLKNLVFLIPKMDGSEIRELASQIFTVMKRKPGGKKQTILFRCIKNWVFNYTGTQELMGIELDLLKDFFKRTYPDVTFDVYSFEDEEKMKHAMPVYFSERRSHQGKFERENRKIALGEFREGPKRKSREIGAFASEEEKSGEDRKDAWPVYLDLLSSKDIISDSAALLCAQAITYKLRHNWSDLDSPAQLHVRDTLLSVLRSQRATNLLREVAVSLAVLSMFMDDWRNPLMDFLSEFAATPELRNVLLEYLTVVSEESYLILQDAKKGSSLLNLKYEELRVREVERLQNNAPAVLQFLQYVCSLGSDAHQNLLRCLTSWLRQGLFKLSDVAETPLLTLPFQLISPDDDDDVYNACYEIITQSEIPPAANQAQYHNSLALLMKVYDLLIQLQSAISQNPDEPEFIALICDLFVHFGSTHIDLLLKEFPRFQVLIEIILQCMQLNNFDVLTRTFYLWHTIDTYIFDDQKSATPIYQASKQHLVPLFTNLLDILMPLLRYPEDFETWPAKRSDDFRDFRHEVGDVLKICVVMTGPQTALRRPFEMLQMVVASQQQGQALNWKDVEAVLFSIRAMGRVVSDDEKDVLPLVMELLPHLPDHPKIKYAAILVIGRYTKWSAYKDNTRFIPQQLTYVFAGFSDKEIIPAAALALRHLADDCGEHMIPYLSQIYANYPTLMSVLENDRIEFIGAIAFIVQRLPPAELTEALQHFCVPLAQSLIDISSRGPGENPRATNREIEETLTYLTEYLKILTLPPSFVWDPTQPLYPVAAFIESLWPILEKIMEQFPGVTGSAIQLIREAIINYPKMLWKFAITTVIPRIVLLYGKTGAPQYLWLSKAIVKQYATNERRDEDGRVLMEMLQRMSESTFTMVDGGVIKGWEKYDVLADYFYLVATVMDECTPFVVSSGVLAECVGFAVRNLPREEFTREVESVDHAIFAVVSFYRDLIYLAKHVGGGEKGKGNVVVGAAAAVIPGEVKVAVKSVLVPAIPSIIKSMFDSIVSDVWVEMKKMKEVAAVVYGLDKVDSEVLRKAILDVVVAIGEDKFPKDAKQMVLDRIASVIDSEKEAAMAEILLRYYVTPYRRANGLPSSTSTLSQQSLPPPHSSTEDRDEQTQQQTNIKIYARVRPPQITKSHARLHLSGNRYWVKENNAETESKQKIGFRVPKDQAQGLINNQRENYEFRFDWVFDVDTGQEEVFDKVAKEVVVSALDGYNGTIFAYGQTGSGKTFTITGGAEKYDDRGLIPRTLQYIFAETKKRQGCHYEISISYMEIYNEIGYDLLDSSRDAKKLEDLPKVYVQEDANDQMYLRNLSCVPAINEEEALNLLFVGDTNRMIAETPSNPSSSRSHCIFIICITERRDGDGRIRRSKLHMVDLAGSERVSRTGINGTLLKEARYINLSLHYLEQVIIALHEKSLGKRSHIPYRNSMMTSLLRDSLGGNCKTTMIATVAVEDELIDESISTCRFAQRVALISNFATRNEELDPYVVIARLKREVARLKSELALAMGGDDSSEVLPSYELERVKQAVDEYVSSTGDDSLAFSDYRKIREAFRLLKSYVNTGGNNRLLLDNAPCDSETMSKLEKIDSADIDKLKKMIVQRDNEINILVGLVDQYKSRVENGSNLRLTEQTSSSNYNKSQSSYLSLSNVFTHASSSTSLTSQDTADVSKPNRPVNPRLTTEKARAFEIFKGGYPSTGWIEGQKDLLKIKYTEAKALGEKADAYRNEIKTLKAELAGVEQTSDIETEQKMNTLKTKIASVVSQYRESYEKLKNFKLEIEHLQHLLEQARHRLTRDFEHWYVTVYLGTDLSNTSTLSPSPEIPTNSTTPIPNRSYDTPNKFSESPQPYKREPSYSSGMSTTPISRYKPVHETSSMNYDTRPKNLDNVLYSPAMSTATSGIESDSRTMYEPGISSPSIKSYNHLDRNTYAEVYGTPKSFVSESKIDVGRQGYDGKKSALDIRKVGADIEAFYKARDALLKLKT
ncbi:Kinesin- protein 6 [Nowakowskiella sp. JEL0407]|nr:Kinesin- protein 6 [Nowakowskiella sp. JEL0407]